MYSTSTYPSLWYVLVVYNLVFFQRWGKIQQMPPPNAVISVLPHLAIRVAVGGHEVACGKRKEFNNPPNANRGEIEYSEAATWNEKVVATSTQGTFAKLLWLSVINISEKKN